MQALILILHVLIAIAIVALVLMQHGKGADMGAGFGAGASNTMFGSQGSTPFLVKLTGGLALFFFLTSGIMSFLMGKEAEPTNPLPIATAPVNAVPAIPVAPENTTTDANPVQTETPAATTPAAKPATSTNTKSSKSTATTHKKQTSSSTKTQQ